MASATNSTASWDELTGSKNWQGLIDPDLNLGIREFILRCGDFCQATYDAFNSTPESPNRGNSNYGKPSFFRGVMLKDATRYQVVSFLYATAGLGTLFDGNFFLHPLVPSAWDSESNWFGFIAVSSDTASGRREVYVVWRGTIMASEWTSNIFGAGLVPASPLFSGASSAQNTASGGFLSLVKEEPKVHEGWLKIYTSQNSLSPYVKSNARAQLRSAIEGMKKNYSGEKLSVIVTGHSLGGSLATLSGFDLAENDGDVSVTVVALCCPQVGNEAFKDRALSLPNLKILQVNNVRDVVPKLPDSVLSIYVPIATAKLEIDTMKSPNLMSKLPSEVLPDFHNLEANLHVVAGWNGMRKPFEMKVKRSLALVNKSCRYLKSEFNVPGLWWTERNKGMVYDELSDEWTFDPPPPIDQVTD